MYQIEGRDVIFDWLSHQSDPVRRQIMLDWLVGWAMDPLSGAHRVPGIDVPVYIAVVRLQPPTVVEFLFAEQFRTVKVIDIRLLP